MTPSVRAVSWLVALAGGVAAWWFAVRWLIEVA